MRRRRSTLDALVARGARRGLAARARRAASIDWSVGALPRVRRATARCCAMVLRQPARRTRSSTRASTPRRADRGRLRHGDARRRRCYLRARQRRRLRHAATPTSCSACSSACTAPRSSRAPASAWPTCAASSQRHGGRSGPRPSPARAPRSTSRIPTAEDGPRDRRQTHPAGRGQPARRRADAGRAARSTTSPTRSWSCATAPRRSTTCSAAARTPAARRATRR